MFFFAIILLCTIKILVQSNEINPRLDIYKKEFVNLSEAEAKLKSGNNELINEYNGHADRSKRVKKVLGYIIPVWNKNPPSTTNQHNSTVIKYKTKKNITSDDADEFVFNFPFDDKLSWDSNYLNYTNYTVTVIKVVNNETDHQSNNSNLLLESDYLQINNETESICIFLKEIECMTRSGTIYRNNKKSNTKEITTKNEELICCILSTSENSISSQIKTTKRGRRSFQNFERIKNKPKERKFTEFGDSDEEDDDPYKNIRGYNPAFSTSKEEYDYADELPSPGHFSTFWELIKTRKTNKTPQKDKENVDQKGQILYNSYETLPNIKRLKESFQIVYYNAEPDFQVLQGFKLPLRKGKSDKIVENSQNENGPHSDPIEYGLYTDKDTTNKFNWLGITTVETKDEICYAVLVNPRAAVTTRKCIESLSSRHVMFIVGIWDNEINPRAVQKRVASIYRNSDGFDEFSDDIVLLHWNEPLKQNYNTRPANLGAHENVNDCLFIEWDPVEGVLAKPRQYQATILSSEDCIGTLSENSICAELQNKITNQGGGVLACNHGSYSTVDGVVVASQRNYYSSRIIAVSLQKWTYASLSKLGIPQK